MASCVPVFWACYSLAKTQRYNIVQNGRFETLSAPISHLLQTFPVFQQISSTYLLPCNILISRIPNNQLSKFTSPTPYNNSNIYKQTHFSINPICCAFDSLLTVTLWVAFLCINVFCSAFGQIAGIFDISFYIFADMKIWSTHRSIPIFSAADGQIALCGRTLQNEQFIYILFPSGRKATDDKWSHWESWREYDNCPISLGQELF